MLSVGKHVLHVVKMIHLKQIAYLKYSLSQHDINQKIHLRNFDCVVQIPIACPQYINIEPRRWVVIYADFDSSALISAIWWEFFPFLVGETEQLFSNFGRRNWLIEQLTWILMETTKLSHLGLHNFYLWLICKW